MNFRTTAGVLAATTVALPLLLAAPASAQEPTGTVTGTVWFDRDGDGTRDAGEPGAALKRVLVDGGDQHRDTGSDGGFSFDGLAPGTHTLTVTTDWAYARTTAETVEVEVVAGGTATVDFGIRGGSVCGTAWKDTDGDGDREDGEPGIAGVNLGLLAGYAAFVTTGADGGYCARDLPPGDYTAHAQDRYAVDGTAWTRAIYHVGCPFCVQDSKVDWRDGSSDPVTITTGPGAEATQIDGFDVGYVDATGNPGTVQLFVNDADGGDIRVGDVVDVVGSVMVGGNVPDRLGATLTLPRGLTVLDSIGGMPSRIDDRTVVGRYEDRRTPHAVEFVVARVRVDRPVHAGLITLVVHEGLYGDTDPADNHLDTTITARR